jgi:V8-like Glu-specific endopeptidase
MLDPNAFKVLPKDLPPPTTVQASSMRWRNSAFSTDGVRLSAGADDRARESHPPIAKTPRMGLDAVSRDRFEHIGNIETLLASRRSVACMSENLETDASDPGYHIHAVTGEVLRQREWTAHLSHFDRGNKIFEAAELGLDSPRVPGSQNIERPLSTAAGCVHGCNEPLNPKLCPDNRTRIVDTSPFPFRAFCSIAMPTASNSPHFGSGCFIGPKHVLTAAHNLYMCIGSQCGWTGGPAQVTDGNGITRTAMWYWLPSAWIEGPPGTALGRRKVDYALITLWEHGSYSAGCFSYSDSSYGQLKKLHTSGFPSPTMLCKTAPVPTEGCAPYGNCDGRLYSGVMRVTKVRHNWFGGDCNCQAGQSGSPLYQMINGIPNVYGVLSQSDGHYTVAKRLRASSVANLKAAIAAHPHSYWGTSC